MGCLCVVASEQAPDHVAFPKRQKTPCRGRRCRLTCPFSRTWAINWAGACTSNGCRAAEGCWRFGTDFRRSRRTQVGRLAPFSCADRLLVPLEGPRRLAWPAAKVHHDVLVGFVRLYKVLARVQLPRYHEDTGLCVRLRYLCRCRDISIHASCIVHSLFHGGACARALSSRSGTRRCTSSEKSGVRRRRVRHGL